VRKAAIKLFVNALL